MSEPSDGEPDAGAESGSEIPPHPVPHNAESSVRIGGHGSGSYRDDLQVPEDASEYAAGLERILRRIPDGWGRRISTGPGWYPLLVELDEAIAAVDASYLVHQVKAKFGGLSYYWTLPALECCRSYAADRHELAVVDLPEDERVALWVPHRESQAHREAEAARAEASSRITTLVREAGDRAAQTCEQTGEPGILMSTSGWYSVLDPVTADPSWVVAETTDPRWLVESLGDDVESLRTVASQFADSLVMYRVALTRMRAVKR